MKISAANRMKLAHFLTRDAFDNAKCSIKLPYTERFAKQLREIDNDSLALLVTKYRDAGREIQQLEWKIDNLIIELGRKKEYAVSADKELEEIESLKSQVTKALATEKELGELCFLFFKKTDIKDELAAARTCSGETGCYMEALCMIEAGYNPLAIVAKLEADWICVPPCEVCGYHSPAECGCDPYADIEFESYCFYDC